MKEFLKNFKIPLILGSIALIVVIATVIIVTGGISSDAGLYITSASGSVSVTNSEKNENAVNGIFLEQGDVVTVGEGSSCSITYKSKKNSDDNCIILGENTQTVISDDLNGKNDGEIFIRNGTAICNFSQEDKAAVLIRTADSTVTVKNSTAKISYYTNEFFSYTDIYTFMGNNTIQLYDSLGNTVNSPEIQIEKRWGRIVSEDMPSFESLNLEFDINELTAFDLKNLITIAKLKENFPYTVEELQAALDAKGEDPYATIPPISGDETLPADSSDTIQTAVPFTESTASPDTVTTLPGNVTTAPHVITPSVTTAPPQTNKPQTTASSSSAPAPQTDSGSNDVQMHTVIIVIDGEETIQSVQHGKDAVKPADPVIEGMTFVGWSGSFENVTEDRTITAVFNEPIVPDTSYSPNDFHIVTVVIGDKTSTITVPDGQSANLPTSVEVEGYVFKGWDKDFTNITSDITITAILEPVNMHTVTFVVEDNSFQVKVAHGDMALPTYIPTVDSQGNRFTGWDKSLGNITSDTTITATFEDENYHNVTFIIDGQFYNIKVRHGERAEPPFQPSTSSAGAVFLFWDHSLDNITEDTVITALYG